MKLMYVNLKYNLMKDAEKDLQKKELTALLDDLKHKILKCSEIEEKVVRILSDFVK